MITEQLQHKLADKIDEQSNIKRKITETKEKQEQLELRFVNGEIDRMLFEKYRQKFESETQELNREIADGPVSSSNLQKAVTKGLGLARNALQLWLSAGYSDKQKLQHFIYPDGNTV